MAKSNVVRQSATVAISNNRICLVTSSSGKRWVIPKGHQKPGDGTRKTAKIEAWEEAGIIGILHDEPVGTYVYEKAGRKFAVTVHVMQVWKVLDRWPERNKRKRRWLSIREARRRIEHPKLRKLISQAMAKIS
jgi:8-oxo-dGTP pyrophosphatase MutT (NUDIX family)